MFSTQNIGDWHGGHGAGNEGLVGCLVGQVVSGDVGTVAGKSYDFNMDQAVLVDHLWDSERLSCSWAHRGEQNVRLTVVFKNNIV